MQILVQYSGHDPLIFEWSGIQRVHDPGWDSPSSTFTAFSSRWDFHCQRTEFKPRPGKLVWTNFLQTMAMFKILQVWIILKFIKICAQLLASKFEKRSWILLVVYMCFYFYSMQHIFALCFWILNGRISDPLCSICWDLCRRSTISVVDLQGVCTRE